MRRPPRALLEPPPLELVDKDDIPLETSWHNAELDLLIDVAHQAMAERGKSDFYASGDMFMYYSFEQARDLAANPYDRRYLRGPDFFWVGGVDGRMRNCWAAWEEGGRLPNVIVELLSPWTAEKDRTVKKDLYARIFRTPEYYLYDPDSLQLEGFRLDIDVYHPIVPTAQGRLPSEQLGLEFGLWEGVVKRQKSTWLRLFHSDGRLVPTAAEALEARTEAVRAERKEWERRRTEAACQRVEEAEARAEAERKLREAAEAEVERLRALLSDR